MQAKLKAGEIEAPSMKTWGCILDAFTKGPCILLSSDPAAEVDPISGCNETILESIFKLLPERNTVVYATLLKGFCKQASLQVYTEGLQAVIR